MVRCTSGCLSILRIALKPWRKSRGPTLRARRVACDFYINPRPAVNNCGTGCRGCPRDRLSSKKFPSKPCERAKQARRKPMSLIAWTDSLRKLASVSSRFPCQQRIRGIHRVLLRLRLGASIQRRRVGELRGLPHLLSWESSRTWSRRERRALLRRRCEESSPRWSSFRSNGIFTLRSGNWFGESCWAFAFPQLWPSPRSSTRITAHMQRITRPPQRGRHSRKLTLRLSPLLCRRKRRQALLLWRFVQPSRGTRRQRPNSLLASK